MHLGTVKWFNNSKGYGFIIPDQGGKDLFVHYSSINMEGYKTLKAGQAVQYEVIDGPKGQHATDIVFTPEAGQEPSNDASQVAEEEPAAPTAELA
ncbi:MAG: cold shock domain-containing protein [Pseudomonadales bacterium]|nr:cold shock domain-containing protein [Pseudomonadales bacterium]